MRRRFGRGRRGKGGAESKNPPIDAARIFSKIVEGEITPATEIAAVAAEGVPDHFAVIGEGTDSSGGALLVGFAPDSGGNAALAVVAEAERRAADGFTGEVFAVAPQWSDADRRRLALLSPQNYRLRAVAASALGDAAVAGDVASSPSFIQAKQLAGALGSGSTREVLLRALAAFEGLAAKHGGAVRGAGSRIELVLLARCAAVLKVGEASGGREAGVVLETILPEHSSETIDSSTLATALDRLEGLLRKRMNDRKIRSGEEGQRGALAPTLAASAGVRGAALWPFGGSDPDIIDFAGVSESGQPVLGAIRESLTLPMLGAILDSVSSLRGSLPALFAELDVSWRLTGPQLLFAASDYDAAALRALGALTLDHVLYDVLARRGRSPDLVLRGRSEGAAVSEEPAAETAPRRSREPRKPREPRVPRVPRESRESGEAASQDEKEEPRSGRAPRRRRRGSARSSNASAADARQEEGADAAGESREASSPVEGTRAGRESKERQFDDFSSFDLDDDSQSKEEQESTPRRRRRRGRRRQRGASEESSTGGSESQEGPASGGDGAKARAFSEPQGDNASVDDDDTVDDITDLADALADVDEPDPDALLAPAYDDEDEEGSSSASDTAPKEAAEVPKRARPRRRAAILAHADRGSVLSAVLLARDLRLIEGIWIYDQADLMTFFRGVAIDLGNDTPIHVVGFNALPARDVLQAAALYADRLDWYDHHDWPPEDLGALREMIGADRVHVYPGTPSSLAAVLSDCTRRSRFSDKLVELLTGRFSDHDYERWGRYWWHRLGEIAAETGDHRADLEPLLAGRPSDLAREAALVPVPAFPPEVEYVSSRDFRIVHFGGYTLVVVPTPAELDEGLAARIARERYAAQMSLAFHEEQETVSLGADEGRGSRGFNLSALVDHLASKHDWIEALPDEDRVASLRVNGLFSVEGRLDEIVREIAMGRSLFES